MKNLRAFLLLAVFVILPLFASGQTVDSEKVDAFAHAIAKAEGFGVKGAVPTRYHNPGDIRTFKKGARYPGQVGVNKHGYVIFKNDEAGFAALRENLRRMGSGESKYYGTSMTISKVAKLYATKWRVWAKNVSHNLGVEPSTTLRAYFKPTDVPAPAVTFDAKLDPAIFNMPTTLPILAQE